MGDVKQLVASRELDALVAERVMGWKKWVPARPESLPITSLATPCWEDTDGRVIAQHSWNPSTEISAAWEVVEKLKQRDKDNTFFLEIEFYNNAWNCQIGGSVEASAPTAPLAICRAALADD